MRYGLYCCSFCFNAKQIKIEGIEPLSCLFLYCHICGIETNHNFKPLQNWLQEGFND